MASAEGINLTEEEVSNYFNVTHTGELSNDDLSMVAGGGKGKWVPILDASFTEDIGCPFCKKRVKVVVNYFENTKTKNTKHDWNPKYCTCGAYIRFYSCSVNFDFEKNGENRNPLK